MPSNATEDGALKKGLYCYTVMFLNFMKVNHPRGLTPVIFPLRNSNKYNFFFTSIREKGEKEISAWKRNVSGCQGFGHLQSAREWERTTLRAPSFSFWEKVLFWQPWLQLSCRRVLVVTVGRTVGTNGEIFIGRFWNVFIAKGRG